MNTTETKETITIEVPLELAPLLEYTIIHYLMAKEKHETFPTCLIHQGALLAEEAGECLKECNNQNPSLARHELYQTLAVGLRMLTHLQEQ